MTNLLPSRDNIERPIIANFHFFNLVQASYLKLSSLDLGRLHYMVVMETAFGETRGDKVGTF